MKIFEIGVKLLICVLLICLIYICYLIGQDNNIIPKDMHCYQAGRHEGQGAFIPAKDCLYNEETELWICSNGIFSHCHDARQCEFDKIREKELLDEAR